MQSITFECEVITPMFLSGADGCTPELRPPSIKGALRFWWRAINGGNWETLKPIEDKIFGSTDSRSKVSIEIEKSNPEISKNIKSNIENFQGIQYLFYSTFMSGDGKPKRASYTKLKFNVTLRAKDRDQTELKKMGYAFWLLANFGGLGTRTRRGAGCFYAQVKEDKDKLLNDLEFGISSKESLDKYFRCNYQKVKCLLVENTTIPSNQTEFSTFKDYGAKITNNPKDDWKNALNEIGLDYKEARENKPNTEKAYLGLPFESKKTVKPENFERRGSPLIIRINKFNDKYYWVMLKLDGIFLPQGNDRLNISGKANPNLLNKFYATPKSYEDKD